MVRFVIFLLFCSVSALHAGPNDAAGNDTSDEPRKPVREWTFDAAAHPGPRAPAYPAFPITNAAALADGSAPVARVADDGPEADHPLRFAIGEVITLEAWVKVRTIRTGDFVYILGKGRAKANTKNQNYALRLKGDTDGARLNFLFSSAPVGDKGAGWHRWTSDSLLSNAGWHHVAVRYKFGEPKSMAGFIDGKPVKGKWDMDGATDRAPAQDGEEVLLGTGNGGGKSNSFSGWLDDVRIWRGMLTDETLKARYQFVPPPPVVRREELPATKVLVHLCEKGMPDSNTWPDEALPPTDKYEEPAFAFFEEPQKYVDTGVRGDRANPHLLRAAALVKLPQGKHRLLLRGRGASRLYIDGKAILSTPFPPGDGGGHGHVAEQKEYLDLGFDFRFRPPGNREAWCEFETAGAEHLIIMETIVGGYMGKNARRPELGETVVAWSPAGSDAWQLLSPAREVYPYNDSAWETYAAQRREHYTQVNAQTRARLRATQDGYWNRRREAAQKWLEATPEEPIPALPSGFAANNGIDHFIAQKVVAARAEEAAAKGGAIEYFRDVQPILARRCYDCHQGGKAKGGLRLDQHQAALKGGKSDGPALAPGKPMESALIARAISEDEDEVMPPKGDRLTPTEIDLLTRWIEQGAHWPDFQIASTKVTPLADDLSFLRRVYLDTVGVPPTLDEIAAAPKDRGKLIDKLLADPRWADNWMGYWQDVLAENPNILNPTLNNTGPFRWWILESLQDNKPMDLFVTELLGLRGSERFGGPAGFGVASQNDVPMAAKGTIVSTAFLGVEMKCARCHDAPAHVSRQEDLFQLAAMLGAKPLEVPLTSSVPMDKIHEGGRKPLIEVTLQPGSKVEPKWPFDAFCAETAAQELCLDPKNPRDVLAAAITAPHNERFAQVMANRVWKRFMGRGIVEPVEDWEKGVPSHPALLRWLGREFVRGGYDLKALARLILNSHAYQRATDTSLRETSPLFASPAPRRLSAEQIVDSLFTATGKPMRTEEASLDIDGSRDLKNSISLGQPSRAWMLTSTSNERDRPSLALPRIQAVADVLAAFGWRSSRQDPLSRRDEDPNTLQPAILSNGIMGSWLARLSDDHGITALVMRDQELAIFIDQLFLKLLTRKPTEAEKQLYLEYLTPGYDNRRTAPEPEDKVPASNRKPPLWVSWSNHLDPEATLVRMEEETAARQGDPPTTRLDAVWRTRLEDVVWSLINAPEFVFTP